ncbi:MAG: hypothetical protein M3162_01295 [Thermoproteota archaeon]|nr:hypothetical protein [Thermoproteota archaeon]
MDRLDVAIKGTLLSLKVKSAKFINHFVSDSTRFNYAITRENAINNFVKDILEDRIDFDYSRSIKEDKDEVFKAAKELKEKIIPYLTVEKDYGNKEYHKLQDEIISCYLSLKIYGVIRSKTN